MPPTRESNSAMADHLPRAEASAEDASLQLPALDTSDIEGTLNKLRLVLARVDGLDTADEFEQRALKLCLQDICDDENDVPALERRIDIFDWVLNHAMEADYKQPDAPSMGAPKGSVGIGKARQDLLRARVLQSALLANVWHLPTL